MLKLNHPAVARAWIERELIGEIGETVLVIETTLDLIGGDDGVNSSALDDLIDQVRSLVERPNLHFSRVRVVPALKATT